MNIAIIEDELPAREQLKSLLNKTPHTIEVIFESSSVRESVRLLEKVSGIDLIFMDIQLNDGLSLDIFKQVSVSAPVIFTTAFDQYTLEAFQQNGIDYLLKPIKKTELEKAIKKYQTLQAHFEDNLSQLLHHFLSDKKELKKRFTVKKGIVFTSIQVREVAYFYTEHKVTFLVTKNGEKFILDKPLMQVESELDPIDFYRINRQYLCAIEAIEGFQSDQYGKLLLHLSPAPKTEVFLSQEKAMDFKKWYEGR